MAYRAQKLRSHHGLDDATSKIFAAILMDPASRCSICGLPNYLIEVYRVKGPWPWFYGQRTGRKQNKTLQLDHVVPGDNNGGLRPLCALCNSRRGAAIYTDLEVLVWVTKKWREFFSPKLLWWLNDTPGEGGRLHRSDFCEKRERKFVAGIETRKQEGC